MPDPQDTRRKPAADLGYEPVVRSREPQSLIRFLVAAGAADAGDVAQAISAGVETMWAGSGPDEWTRPFYEGGTVEPPASTRWRLERGEATLTFRRIPRFLSRETVVDVGVGLGIIAACAWPFYMGVVTQKLPINVHPALLGVLLGLVALYALVLIRDALRRALQTDLWKLTPTQLVHRPHPDRAPVQHERRSEVAAWRLDDIEALEIVWRPIRAGSSTAFALGFSLRDEEPRIVEGLDRAEVVWFATLWRDHIHAQRAQASPAVAGDPR